MHTSLREPHIHIHARIAFGLALDFFGSFCIKTKERKQIEKKYPSTNQQRFKSQ